MIFGKVPSFLLICVHVCFVLSLFFAIRSYLLLLGLFVRLCYCFMLLLLLLLGIVVVVCILFVCCCVLCCHCCLFLVICCWWFRLCWFAFDVYCCYRLMCPVCLFPFVPFCCCSVLCLVFVIVCIVGFVCDVS